MSAALFPPVRLSAFFHFKDPKNGCKKGLFYENVSVVMDKMINSSNRGIPLVELGRLNVV